MSYRTKQKPESKPPLTRLDWMCEALSAVFLVFLIIYTLTTWRNLPEIIPIHFNINGVADNYTSKNLALLFPGIALLMYILMGIGTRFPHLFNYPVKITAENQLKQYVLARSMMSIMKAIIIAMLAYTYYAIYTSTLNDNSVLDSRVMILFVALLLGSVAIYFSLALKNRKDID